MFDGTFTPAEMEAVLDALRSGMEVSIGGSRCHTTYLFRDGQFHCDGFDEGYIEEQTCSEEAIRETVASHPHDFVPLLRGRLYPPVAEALRRRDRAAARRHLAALRFYGDPFEYIAFLDAILTWPEDPAPLDLRNRLRSTVAGHTGYHLVMTMMSWQKTPDTGLVGVWIFDTIESMVGPTRRLRSQRGSFREMAGDLDGAIEDLTVELSHTPLDDADRASLEKQVVALRNRRDGSPAAG